MTPQAIDGLCRVSLVSLCGAVLFAAIGDQGAALASCGLGLLCGIVASWHDPTIRPWQ